MHRHCGAVLGLVLALMVTETAAGRPLRAQQPVEAALTEARLAFSAAYVVGDWNAIESAYTADAVAIAAGREPVHGREAIRRLFETAAGVTILHHGMKPEEVVVSGDHAYDWGTYEIRTARGGTPGDLLRGTYVLVWRREPDGRWRMKLDMWALIR